MSNAALSPCPECQRHVRVDSQECPFCARDLTGAPLPVVPDMGAARLSRAAIFAFATSVAACTTAQAPPQSPPPPQAAVPQPVVTAPPPDPAAAPPEPGTVAAIYGAPAPVPMTPDAGMAPDSGPSAPTDAGNPTRPTRPTRPGSSIMMRYGAPPVPDEFV